MIEQLGQIDTDSIDELIDLKKQRDVLIERLDRLTDQEKKVSEVVMDRVRSDYESQRRALADQAEPLKEHARREFSKLELLMAKAREALEAIELNREELELRHQVGEFGDAEFTQHRDEIAENHAGQEQDLTQIEEVRESFLSAFDSEEDLAAGASVEAREPDEEGKNSSDEIYETQETERRGFSFPVEDLAEGASQGGDGEGVSEGSGADDSDREGTVIEAYEAPEEEEAEQASSLQPMPPDAIPTGGTVLLSVPETTPDIPEIGATTVLQQARLVPVEPIAGGSEFAIEPITTIGRTKDNLIRVDEPAVSRNHAQISLTNEGYLLRDLGSENGSYVNGERMDSRLLAEGDRIQIGTVRFVFYDAGS